MTAFIQAARPGLFMPSRRFYRSATRRGVPLCPRFCGRAVLDHAVVAKIAVVGAAARQQGHCRQNWNDGFHGFGVAGPTVRVQRKYKRRNSKRRLVLFPLMREPPSALQGGSPVCRELKPPAAAI